MAYTNYAAVKAELKLTNDNDQTLIDGYVTLAQRLIEASRPLGTGRVFEVSVDATRYLDAPRDTSDRSLDGPLYLLLLTSAGDLCSITSVVNGDGETLTTADYVTEPRTQTPYYAIRLKSGSGKTWTWEDSPEGAISVTGKWAYSTSAPADIQRAALRLCAWMYRARDNDGFDQDIHTQEGLTVLGSKMPRDIRQIIETYWTVL